MFSNLSLQTCPRALALALVATSMSAQQVPVSQTPAQLSAMTVTGTREKAPLFETPISVGAIAADAIRETAPLHPGQLLGQVPGVAVAVTNGEGHTTAIRQPFTTSPVYLFLEDGVPVRATGFFNHNALYEVNVPMAGGVEIVRGPGTALYGSDAIGGIVNVLSRAPDGRRRLALSGEMGAFGTWRGLASGGGAVGRAAHEGWVQVDLNMTHTDGWRDRTAYDRRSGSVRFDQALGGAGGTVGAAGTLKAIVGFSAIEQETGANSALPYADYVGNPKRNNFAIAYRNVRAVRASVEYERVFDGGDGMVSVIPYFRDNAMELNGTFNLNSDPRIERTHNVSYGVLAKWRRNFRALRTRVIGGIDFDYSPGTRAEDNLLVTRSGTGANTVFSAYTLGTRIYDYRVTFRSVSPYVHTEFSPLARLRITAGLRFDRLQYAMTNRLTAGTVAANVHGAARHYGQVGADERAFERVSPKLGATYALSATTSAYASYNFGFRAPSEGQLYRAGIDATPGNALARAGLALGLKPIRARQVEVGLRGRAGAVSYEIVGYELEKRDDLVSQRDLATNVSTGVNAGRTEHRGIELGAGVALGGGVRVDTAVSYSRHRYVDWVTATGNFSGREIEAAPRVMTNTRVTWRPGAKAMLQAEWVKLGSYWLEAGNSAAFGKYAGHDLVNVRGSYAIARRVTVFARVMNAADKRFAESASVSSNTPVFSPGLPRAVYGGVEVAW